MIYSCIESYNFLRYRQISYRRLWESISYRIVTNHLIYCWPQNWKYTFSRYADFLQRSCECWMCLCPSSWEPENWTLVVHSEKTVHTMISLNYLKKMDTLILSLTNLSSSFVYKTNVFVYTGNSCCSLSELILSLRRVLKFNYNFIYLYSLRCATHALTLKHARTHTHSNTHARSHSNTRAHTLTLKHTHACTQTHARSHSNTHTRG